MKVIILKYIQIIVISITLSACATNPTGGFSSTEQNPDSISPVNPDPYEHINRKIFKFNEEFDDKILIPFAKGYRKYLPRPVRIAIYNFFSNTAEGRNLVNSLLQGKLHNAVDTFS